MHEDGRGTREEVPQPSAEGAGQGSCAGRRALQGAIPAGAGLAATHSLAGVARVVRRAPVESVAAFAAREGVVAAERVETLPRPGIDPRREGRVTEDEVVARRAVETSSPAPP
jgi:hypothetical protein